MILFVALTCFLSSAKSSPDDAHHSFLREYLERHLDCEHVLSPLAFDREKRTQDLVGQVGCNSHNLLLFGGDIQCL